MSDWENGRDCKLYPVVDGEVLAADSSVSGDAPRLAVYENDNILIFWGEKCYSMGATASRTLLAQLQDALGKSEAWEKWRRGQPIAVPAEPEWQNVPWTPPQGPTCGRVTNVPMPGEWSATQSEGE
jgi:hypothetical protein